MTTDALHGGQPSKLRNFHITFFAIVLGMAGFTLAIQKAGALFVQFEQIGTVSLYFTLALFVIVSLTYLTKAVTNPDTISHEWNHPIKINFFPLIAKIFLVLSVVYLERNLQVSYYMWVTGVILQLLASIFIISSWITQTHFKIEHMTPGWFIPIVGAIIVPIAGVKHGFTEVSWFFFSVGLIFWMALFTIVMYRMVFHASIPERLLPTLFILFAPPAIGFIAYNKLVGGELDAFARILYYFSLFMFILVLFRLPMLAKINYYLSWWAYSFPVAAKVLATLLMFTLTKDPFFRNLAIFELAFLILIIAVLLVRTTMAIAKGEICVED
ncbi:MAG: SLAC1 anion channel family protein [Chlorobium sp.]|jgi:tellurite resistance protein|uniref:SLAC1 anion channel family protein n=1 Tax=Chlorobium sp. TaxID=1095 RepID=UPI001DA3106E|nr:SLAC1 anion channel family protein [Chlorobium sp.]MBN1279509.1 SLAC1 anion channel family protein [Chlorobiaceae bacterium]MCF8216250.1 SLAC1 anion channel family protein [Chlorobium sp.]MCF8271152.1 SLAC1 anion channel family protein [Chlorobium sp.]MCF8287526.1 SLAC1 anion channel family protein [Chlorobium sp.]MCF8291065.1 SLAC1 anion channel family protein [Chlorobium sp.]